MKITMEENDMNESKQIRERFLADTRQHFFADDSIIGRMQAATRQNNNPCRCSTDQPRHGKSGA